MVRWELLIYAIVATGMASFSIFTILVSRRRNTSSSRTFVGMVLAATLWAFTSALEKIPPDVPTKILISQVQYFGISAVPPLWLTFVLQYTRRDRLLRREILYGMWILPIVSIALVWTNGMHHLIWTSVTPVSSAIGAPSIYEHSPLFWFFAAYNYLCMLIGCLVLIWALIYMPVHYKSQARLLLAGILISWLNNLLYLAGITITPGLDMTSLSFLLAGVLISWGILKHQMLDLIPIARDAVVEQMVDAVLVLDEEERLIDMNARARALLGMGRNKLAGNTMGAVFPYLKAKIPAEHSDQETVSEISLPDQPAMRYELRTALLKNSHGQHIGYALTLRDITRRSIAEEELKHTEAERRRLKEAQAIELERNRIAQEIHDGLAQNLAALRMRLRRWGNLIETAPERLSAELQGVQELVDSSLLEARRSIFALRPLALSTRGFLPALEQFASGFSEYYNLQIHLEYSGLKNQLSSTLELTLFRIIQEGLNNIAKHAHASHAWITLADCGPDQVQVEVRDDGQGFDPAELEHSERHGSFGLQLMQERAQAAGGQLRIESRPGSGTRIIAVLPITATSERGSG